MKIVTAIPLQVNLGRSEDLSKIKYGMLAPINRVENFVCPGGQKMIQWKCLCDCGKTTYVLSISLKSKSTRSCGCIRIAFHKNKVKDLSGNKYGILTVLSRASDVTLTNGRNAIRWNCECACGRKIVFNADHLKSKISCGCQWMKNKLDKQHVLYRFYDKESQLLYAGITVDLPRRLIQHSKDKFWWHDVALKTIEYFDNRALALAAETQVVLEENPVYNIVKKRSGAKSKS
jgi:hypothetical protein